MATVPVLNWKKERVGEVDLPAEVFEYPYRRHLVWEVVKAYRAGQRAGTHSTKVRSEVSGSGKKPFKQKGTGRARQGGSRRRFTGTGARAMVLGRALMRRASRWGRRRTP